MKKLMMRLSVLVLAGMMLAGGSNTSSTKSNDETATEREKKTITDKESEETEEVTTAATTIEETTIETTEETTAATEVEFASGGGTLTRGIWEDNVYTNDFAGITFTAPDGFVINDDEEIAAMMQIGADVLGEGGADFPQEVLDNIASLYDMVAMDMSTGSSVMVMFENLTANSALGAVVDESLYLESLKAQLEQMEAAGLIYTLGDVEDYEIGGQAYKMLTATTTMESAGISVEMGQAYIVKKIDNYIAAIVITAGGGMDLDTMISTFE